MAIEKECRPWYQKWEANTAVPNLVSHAHQNKILFSAVNHYESVPFNLLCEKRINLENVLSENKKKKEGDEKCELK